MVNFIQSISDLLIPNELIFYDRWLFLYFFDLLTSNCIFNVLKNLFAILALAFIFMFSCGSYFLHLSYLRLYKQEFKSYIKTGQIQSDKTTITIATKYLYNNSSNIVWEDGNEEIFVNGVLYDIISIKTNALSTILSVVSDQQELELKKQFTAIYDVSKNKKESYPFLKSFFSLKSVLNHSSFEFKNQVSTFAKNYLDPIYKTATIYSSQETPPPNFIG